MTRAVKNYRQSSKNQYVIFNLHSSAWAKDNSGIDYSSIAAGFKGLLPCTSSPRSSCCDDDGLAIDGCVSRLKRNRFDEWNLLIRYYAYHQSKRAIAR